MDLSGRPEFEKWCKTKSSPMLRILDKYWLSLDPDDDSLTPCLVRDGYWESWVSLAIARAIKQGWSCVDAGANVGWYTFLMLEAGAGRVAAIEPNQRVWDILNKAMVGNGLMGSVGVSRVALGAMPGKAEMNEYDRFGGSSSIFKSVGYEVSRTFEVEVVPLDLILANWKEIDFIKMDIEGAELDAWRGMEDIRTRCGPIICMEIHKDHGYDVPEFLDEIKRDGYDIRSIREDGEIVDHDPENWALWLTRR